MLTIDLFQSEILSNPTLAYDIFDDDNLAPLGVPRSQIEEAMERCISQPWYQEFVKGYLQYTKSKPKKKEVKRYAYQYTQTLNKQHSLEDLYKIISALENRAKTLGVIKMTHVIEHPDSNPHFHMVIETTKPMKKNRITCYAKYGFQKWQPIRDLDQIPNMTQGYYMKESEPVVKII